MALTFDDGPFKTVTRDLGYAGQIQCPRDFLCIGFSRQKHPELLKGIAGHGLGATLMAIRGSRTFPEKMAEELRKQMR